MEGFIEPKGLLTLSNRSFRCSIVEYIRHQKAAFVTVPLILCVFLTQQDLPHMDPIHGGEGEPLTEGAQLF